MQISELAVLVFVAADEQQELADLAAHERRLLGQHVLAQVVVPNLGKNLTLIF